MIQNVFEKKPGRNNDSNDVPYPKFHRKSTSRPKKQSMSELLGRKKNVSLRMICFVTDFICEFEKNEIASESLLHSLSESLSGRRGCTK